MFQFARAFLLCGLLVSTLTAADQTSPVDVKSEEEALQEALIEDAGAETDDEARQGELIEDVGSETGQQLKLSSIQNDKCVKGFDYQRSVERCYQIVFESHDWYSAGRRCQELQPGAHLVAIRSEAENNALKAYLARRGPSSHGACKPPELKRKGGMVWTSGQRRNEHKCQNQSKNPFVWKVPGQGNLPFYFTYWRKREPNCHLFREHCVLIWYDEGFGWNDERCSLKICPLCEYQPST